MPDLEILTEHNFEEKLARHRWLISFTFGDKNTAAHEYKKLSARLIDYHIQVGKVNCMSEADLCASLYIQKPCVAVFKGLGIHNFEIHH
ncbi:dnaJ-like subfamily C member 10, partial [Silurus asotus]